MWEKQEEKSRERRREVWRKWFRRDNLIVLVLLGVLLFIIALPVEKKGDGGTKDRTGDTEKKGGQDSAQYDRGGAGAEGGQSADASSRYAREQEGRLTDILSAMEGVGEVKVMLTIAVSEELVVEKDTRVSRSSVDEKDASGGSRVSAQVDTGDTTVYGTGTAEGGSMPYVVKTLNPRVEGVLVVAEGAGNGTVNRQITQIVQALFGVEAHRVKVVPMDRGSPNG